MSATLQRLLAQGEQALREAGVDSPELDARLLAQEALRLNHAELIIHRDESVPAPLAAEYLALIRRRAAREPLSYVLGYADFYGRRFLCDRRALAPRPETELLVEAASEPCRALGPGTVVAEVGLGSGVIALSLALECRHLEVWGTEISPAALQLARANACFHRVTSRVRLAEGSLLQPLHEAGVAEQVAVVISNPPYVRSGDLAGLQPEVSTWEPRLALDGGPEGTDVYQALLAECSHLPRLQAIFLEVGYDTAEVVAALARRTWGEAEVSVRPDLAGIPRVLTVRLPQAAPAGEARERVAVEAG